MEGWSHAQRVISWHIIWQQLNEICSVAISQAQRAQPPTFLHISFRSCPCVSAAAPNMWQRLILRLSVHGSAVPVYLRSLWDGSSMREFRTFTCRIGPLLEVDLTKKESLADPKFAILAESYVCSSHPQLKWTTGLFVSRIYKWFHCWRYDFKGVCAVDCPQICCILLQRMLSLICTPWEWFRRIRFLQQHSISFCSCNKDAPSSIETSTTADPLEFDVKCHSPSTVANFLPFLHPLLSSHSPRTDPGFVGFIHIFQLKLQKFDPMDFMRSMFLERSRWRHVLRFLWSLISEKQKSLFSAFQQWPVDVNQHNPATKCVEMHTNY